MEDIQRKLWRDASEGNIRGVEAAIGAMGRDEIDYKVETETYVNGVKVACTPLLMAARNGRCTIVARLATSGARLNFKDAKMGQTPLIVASLHGHVSTVQALIKAGADRDTDDQGKMTALMHASTQGYADIAQALITAGAALDAKGSYGDTALHCASRHGHSTVVKVLLDARADLTLRNQANATALDLARQAGHRTVEQLLLARMAATQAPKNTAAESPHAHQPDTAPTNANATATATAHTAVPTGDAAAALVKECDILLAQCMSVPPLRDAMRRRDAMRAQYETLRETSSDFGAIGRAGMRLRAAEAALAGLALSEEDYRTLTDRHAALVQRVADRGRALVQRVADRGRALAQEGAFDTAVTLGAKLKALQDAALCTELIAELVAECDHAVAQLSQAPALADAIAQRDSLRQEYDQLVTAGTDFRAIAAVGTALEAAIAAVAQQPLSEENYLTLVDRHAALVQRATAKCQELVGAGNYTALKVLSDKLEELRSADTTGLRVGGDGTEGPPSAESLNKGNSAEDCLGPASSAAEADAGAAVPGGAAQLVKEEGDGDAISAAWSEVSAPSGGRE